jgi:hypothetical protein
VGTCGRAVWHCCPCFYAGTWDAAAGIRDGLDCLYRHACEAGSENLAVLAACCCGSAATFRVMQASDRLQFASLLEMLCSAQNAGTWDAAAGLDWTICTDTHVRFAEWW